MQAPIICLSKTEEMIPEVISQGSRRATNWLLIMRQQCTVFVSGECGCDRFSRLWRERSHFRKQQFQSLIGILVDCVPGIAETPQEWKPFNP